jgi:hypothetical protein
MWGDDIAPDKSHRELLRHTPRLLHGAVVAPWQALNKLNWEKPTERPDADR